MKIKLYSAIFICAGTIIGAGMFALPYVTARAGLLMGIVYLLLFALITYWTLGCFAEVILCTRGFHHQLGGYAEHHFGKTAKHFVAAIQIFTSYGSLLVYTIGIAELLAVLSGSFLPETDERWFGAIFILISFVIVRYGMKGLRAAESWSTFIMLLLIVGLIVWTIPFIKPLATPLWDWSFIGLPFGVVMFAYGGLSAVTLMSDILARDRRLLKKAIGWGVFIPLLFYLVFTISTVLATGVSVTPDALIALGHIGNYPFLVPFGAVLGIFAMATSFWPISHTLGDAFCYDYKIPRWCRIIFLGLIPLALYLFSNANFIGAISITGGVLSTLLGIVVVALYNKVRVHRERTPEINFIYPKYLTLLLIIVFISGLIWEIYRTLIHS